MLNNLPILHIVLQRVRLQTAVKQKYLDEKFQVPSWLVPCRPNCSWSGWYSDYTYEFTFIMPLTGSECWSELCQNKQSACKWTRFDHTHQLTSAANCSTGQLMRVTGMFWKLTANYCRLITFSPFCSLLNCCLMNIMKLVRCIRETFTILAPCVLRWWLVICKFF